MTPDTCPHCRSPRRDERSGTRKHWSCGTYHVWSIEMQEGALFQGEQCARYVRTRISQLKRMAEAIPDMVGRAANRARRLGRLRTFDDARSVAIQRRAHRVSTAILREIDRLRGGA